MVFSSDFEFLCSELSMICLRIKLWGESHGVNLEIDNLPASLTKSPELESTTTQCIATIINVLTEVETIRQKYEYQRPLHPSISSTKDIKVLEPSVSLVELSRSRAVTRLRRRIRDNQKQKSCLKIAKWNMVDAKKFEDKISKLRIMIDGLECISCPRRQMQLPTPPPSSPVVSYSDPPPYSSRIQSTLSRYALEQNSYEELSEELYEEPMDHSYSETTLDSPYAHNSLIPYTSFPPPSLNQEIDTEIEAHYAALLQHSGPLHTIQTTRHMAAREKLFLLSEQQFEDLRVDIYDELSRRNHCPSSNCRPLSSTPHYNLKRNQAREKLAALETAPFKDLVIDILFEMERRFPSLVVDNMTSQHQPQFQSSYVHARSQSESHFMSSERRRGSNPRMTLLRSQSSDATVRQIRRMPLSRSTSAHSTSTTSQRQRSPPPPLQFRSPHPTTISSSSSSSSFTEQENERETGPETSIFEPDTPPMTPITLCPSPRTPTQYSTLSPVSPITPFSPHPSPLQSAPLTPRTQTFSPQSHPSTSHPSTSQPSPTTSSPSTNQNPSSSPNQQPPTPPLATVQNNTCTYQSFHITPTSTTSHILPQALLKYGIASIPGEYSLYVVWDNGVKERKLRDEERPLSVFKGLELGGGKPTFVLRREEVGSEMEKEGEEEERGGGDGVMEGEEGMEGEREVEREDDGWRPMSGVRESAIGVGY